jgi:hypothetical protein
MRAERTEKFASQKATAMRRLLRNRAHVRATAAGVYQALPGSWQYADTSAPPTGYTRECNR